jgi:2-oxoglutarate ferredoxin oxidoreductase subunit gamma
LTKADRYAVILAGSGGQGLVLSGVILGQAAILDGKNVVQTVSYGIASRGGFSQAEVIIDRDEIIYQQVEQPDIVLALTAEAMELYAGMARTRVFYDSRLPAGADGPNLAGYPFTRLAAGLGQSGAANMIALGVLASATGVVTAGSLVKVIGQRFSPPLAQSNVMALHTGIALGTGAAEGS